MLHSSKPALRQAQYELRSPLKHTKLKILPWVFFDVGHQVAHASDEIRYFYIKRRVVDQHPHTALGRIDLVHHSIEARGGGA